jgi:hypothetical protein
MQVDVESLLNLVRPRRPLKQERKVVSVALMCDYVCALE